MTSLLKKTVSGIQKKPLFALLFGEPNSGKTTFASQFPKPYFIDVEHGSLNLDVERALPDFANHVIAFDETIDTLKDLLNNSTFETVVIDTADRLEALLWAKVCSENGWLTIEDPGYGKGYMVALKKWEEALSILKRLRQTKNVLIICHSQIKTVNDPMQLTPYDRIELKLNKHAAALLRENTDMILFAARESILKTDKNTKKAKEIAKEYVLYTSGGPGFEGKNRYAMPEKLPLSFQEFWSAYSAGQNESPAKFVSQIKELIPSLTKEKATEVSQFIETNKTNTNALRSAYNRVLILTRSKTEEKENDQKAS